MTQTEQIDLDRLREEFVAWLRTKDADEAYDFWSNTMCPAGQYAASLGEPPMPEDVPVGSKLTHRVWHGVLHLSWQVGCVLAQGPHTFGALLSRMEAIDATPAS